MDEQLIFLQYLYRFMEKEQIQCSFESLPREDPAFWNFVLQQQQSDDQKTLERIARCLRTNRSDFYCVETIASILVLKGYDVAPRHEKYSIF